MEGGPELRAEQAELFNTCFKKRVRPDDLRWRYDEGPGGRSLTLLWREGGRAAGGYACNPRRVFLRGIPGAVVVGETGDVMTDPGYRGRGIFSRLDRACMQRAKVAGWPLAFGLPNHRSAPIFLALGWESAGTCRPWTGVLRSSGPARKLLSREGRLGGARLWLGRLRMRRAQERMLAAFPGPVPAIEPLADFPREVDELARRVARDFALMVARDADYLQWRFLRSPSGLHRCFALREEGRLTGYVVVQAPRPGDTLGYLVDLLADGERAKWALLRGALSELSALGADLVRASAIDGSWWSAQLAGIGFQPSRDSRATPVILNVLQPKRLDGAILDARNWYFTDGDRDDETMG